jgi:hypothetical protein
MLERRRRDGGFCAIIQSAEFVQRRSGGKDRIVQLARREVGGLGKNELCVLAEARSVACQQVQGH